MLKLPITYIVLHGSTWYKMRLLSFHEPFKATCHIVCTRLNVQITTKSEMYRDQILREIETLDSDCQLEIEYAYDFRIQTSCVSSILALVEKVARI